MRIAFALGGTDWGRSGIGTYVRAVLPRLAGRLAGNGDTLAVLGSRRDFDAYGEVDGSYRVRVPDVADAPGASALFYLTGVGRLARRTGADVLLLPAANRRVVVGAGLPVVAVVHDLAQLHVEGKYDPLRMAYFRHVVVRALRSMRELVAVSAATERDLARTLGPGAPRIRVVPNGVDHERFVPAAGAGDPRVTDARRVTGLDGPYVLYASRLEHPGKNHVRLLGAFARSKARETHLLALAGKDWGGEALLRETVARHGLADRVRFLGFVPDGAMPGLVAGADAVVMVGLHEGFGLPALEALAAGRPVCASRTGALPEVVGPLGALCDPLDERSIEEALDRALHDAALRDACATEGPRWAAARSWDRTADGLVEACRDAAQ